MTPKEKLMNSVSSWSALGDGDSEIDRQRGLPEERKCQADSGSDAGADCTEADAALNVADVGEDDAAEIFAVNRGS